MPFLILPERNRCKSLLQTHGEDGAILLILRQSDRSFIDALRPDVLREIHQFFLYLTYSLDDMRYVIWMQIFGSFNSELRVTKS